MSSSIVPVMQPGYRFQPTDDLLVTHYLARMIRSEEEEQEEEQEQQVPFVHPANIYAFHPMALTAAYPPANDHGHWYFFTRREAKHAKGKRPDRRAGDGFWKASGGLQKVKDEENRVVGRKMTLVYYESSPHASHSKIKTNWIMHEFQHASTTADFQSWVLCRISHNGKPQPEPLSTSAPEPYPASSLPALEYCSGADWTPMPALQDPAEHDAEILSWINDSPSHGPAETSLLSSHTTSTACSPLPPSHSQPPHDLITPSPWLHPAASDIDCGFDGGLAAHLLAKLFDS